MEKEIGGGAKEEGGESKRTKPRRERKEEVGESSAPGKFDESVNGSQKPRRRRVDDEDTPSTISASPKVAGGGGGGGWMDSSAASASAKEDSSSLNKAHDFSFTSAAAQKNKDKHFDDNDNDEIIVIPDLDEDGADADHRVAHAPRNITRRIPTLSELENEAEAAMPTPYIEGLDLSVLQSSLVPLELVKENDVGWTFESLLSEVTDDINGTHQPQPKAKKIVVLSPVKPSKLSPKKKKKSSDKNRD